MLEGVAEVLLLDDLDDGDAFNVVGGEWVIYDDTLDGGESTTVPPSWDEAPFASDSPGYGDVGSAAHVSGTTGGVLGHDFVGLDMEETFLLASREEAPHASIDVFSSSSPMGVAVTGKKVGEQASYQTPNGKEMTVEILKIDSYAH